MTDLKQFYILRTFNDDTRLDAVWWIGPFAAEMAASAWAEAHIDDRSGDWQLLGFTAAEVSRPLRLVQPVEAEERRRAWSPAEELLLHRLDPDGRDH